MSSIFLCNTGSDSISKVFLDEDKLVRGVFELGDKPVGPHGIKVYKNEIFTANNYSDSISIFDVETLKEGRNIKIGPKPNDLICYDNKAYTVCGESNNLVIYDFIEEKITMEIETGNWPHSIAFCDSQKLIFISNLEGHSVTVIGAEENNIIKTLSTPEYPTKLLVSKDEKYLYVCESYLGDDKPGYLEIFSTSNLKSIKRIKVGASPIDIFESDDKVYVSNLTDGSVTIINKLKLNVERRIYIGGMPKGLVKYLDKLYVSDYLKGKLYVIENKDIKKVIVIESEPNAMILI